MHGVDDVYVSILLYVSLSIVVVSMQQQGVLLFHEAVEDPVVRTMSAFETFQAFHNM